MPVPEPILRPAHPADIAALAELARRSYRAAFAGILTEAELATRDLAYFRDRFALTWMKVTVLEDAGRLIGFGMLNDGHIDMIFLDPDDTGRGLGRRLMAYLETAGARTLECFADNHAARGFYERVGWRLSETYRRSYLGRDVEFVLYKRDASRKASDMHL
jgi:putative acetyltransferase